MADRKGGSRIVDPVRFTTSNNRRVAMWQETSASAGGYEVKELVAMLLVGELGEYLMAVYSEHPDTYSTDSAEQKVSELVSSVRRLN